MRAWKSELFQSFLNNIFLQVKKPNSVKIEEPHKEAASESSQLCQASNHQQDKGCDGNDPFTCNEELQPLTGNGSATAYPIWNKESLYLWKRNAQQPSFLACTKWIKEYGRLLCFW